MKLRPGGWMPASISFLAPVAMIAFTGCGGGDAAQEQARQEGPQLAQPINLADCRAWSDGSVEERLGTIREIREFFGAPTPGVGVDHRSLDDERAYDLFEGWCEEKFARGFRLYKLYARAQAFSR